MSREKFLWIMCGGLAIVAAALAILLVNELQSARPPSETPPAEPENALSEKEPASSEPAEPRAIAAAGTEVLAEDVFFQGLKTAYGRQYVRDWLERTVVRLEAQALGVGIGRSEVDEELRRMQVGYESEQQFYRIMEEQLGLSRQQLRDDALHRLQLEAIATANVNVSNSDVEQYIQEHPDEFSPYQEIRYAQIVVDSEEAAARVLERLDQGADFALLARDVSQDGATADEGGDSGWVSADDPFIPDEVRGLLASMSVGDVSASFPLAEDGWWIVMLMGRRTINPLDDSDVRESLRRELALAQAPSLFDVVDALLEKYNAVDFLEDD